MVQDSFERAREGIWGTPGFEHQQTTVQSEGNIFFPQSTWVVESCRSDDTSAIFLQRIDAEGGQRIVIPNAVVRVLYRHYEQILKKRLTARAQKAVITRRRKLASAAENMKQD